MNSSSMYPVQQGGEIMRDMQGTSFEDEQNLKRIREASEEQEEDEDVGEFLSKSNIDDEDMDEFFLGASEEFPDYEEEF